MVYIENRLAKASPEAVPVYQRLLDLHNAKLWHQLTEELKNIVLNPHIDDKQGLYYHFIQEFEGKLNPVFLVQILIGIARADWIENDEKALAFLSPHLCPESKESRTVVTVSPEAHVLLLSEVARLRLRLMDNEGCKHAVEEAREIVDSTFEMAPIVHSAFYQAAAEYHKLVGTASEFFKNALQFLAYTSPDSLTIAEQHQWAFDIGMAALIGQDIYNFGEVLSHTIIRSLNESDHAWLYDLLVAFHEGSLSRFNEVCKHSSKKMNEQKVLVMHEEFLRQKITLLALMELAFTRSLDRTLTFRDVAVACRVPASEVEYLLMRAMSLGLISGIIDNVDEIVSITRVQPRVLTKEPIADMARRLQAWCDNVRCTLEEVEKESTELLV